MKKIFMAILPALLLAAGILLSPVGLYNVQAEVTEDGIYYIVNADRTIAIRGLVADTTELVIPAEIEGKPVTGIYGGAFQERSGLTSVTIPEGVEWIGSQAFYGCSGLTSVSLPASVTKIGDDAFYGCSSLASMTVALGGGYGI